MQTDWNDLHMKVIKNAKSVKTIILERKTARTLENLNHTINCVTNVQIDEELMVLVFFVEDYSVNQNAKHCMKFITLKVYGS